MTKLYDVMAAGIAAVDELLYVSEYPPLNCKVPIHINARHGGGPACTAIAAVGALHGRAAYVARLDSGELSNYIRSALHDRHVNITHIVHDADGGPYHSRIVIDAAGHRNVFYDASRYRVIQPDHLPDALIQSASVFLLDHITEPSLLPLAEKIHRLGVPILADIEGHSESALALAAIADFLIVPAEFASWATGESNPAAACGRLAQTQRLATVVTSGADGCCYSIRPAGPVQHKPAFSVEAFDTTGCGDTFHGAFALAVARRLAIDDAITFATAAAALKASAASGKHRGWDALPGLEDVFLFLRTRTREPKRASLLMRLEALRSPTQPSGSDCELKRISDLPKGHFS